MASLQPLQGTLGTRRAAHLLRRASFRYSKSKVDDLSNKSVVQAVTGLLNLNPLTMDQPLYDDPATPAVENATWINPPGLTLPAQDFVLRRYITGWWLNEARLDPGAGSKMMVFFHQYMITTVQTATTANFYDYLALIRYYCLGNFKKLALKMVADNVMLRYLNNQSNTNGNPNENFAREFLELFTIGKGPQAGPGDYTNYTEDDIIQAARVLTGWRVRTRSTTNVDTETGIPCGGPNASLHDTGSKTFSSRFQNTTIPGGANVAGMRTELQAFIDMVFAQKETARNLCRRLYRYFVSRKITAEIETDIIEPLATTLFNNGYEVKPVLSQLFQSVHFYDMDDSDNADEIIGGLIKSPLELAYEAITFFNLPVPSATTQNQLHYVRFYSDAVQSRMLGMAGFPLFYASDVAGYPAYYQEPDYNRAWFNSSSIIARYKLPQMLLTGTRVIGGGPNTTIGIKLDIAPWVRDSGFVTDPSDGYELVSTFLKYMFPEQVDADRFSYFYNDVFLDNLPAADWTYEWQNYIATGNASEVKVILEKLINAIMYAPEYQCF